MDYERKKTTWSRRLWSVIVAVTIWAIALLAAREMYGG